jgi:hypothetical protein
MDSNNIASNLKILTDNLNTIENVVQPFSPLVSLVSTSINIISEAIKIYENAKHNKNICASLMDRISIAKSNIEIVRRHQKFYEKKFKIHSNYKALYRFVEAIKKIKYFMNEVSNLSGWKKYANANSVRENFTKLIDEFDSCMNDLHFAVTLSNEEQRLLDQENLDADIEEMKEVNYLKFSLISYN